MSTKTTFKRIALVAVAALGLGVLSVAPSQAAIDETLTISATSASIAVGESATVTITNTFTSASAGESSTIFISGTNNSGASILAIQTADSANTAMKLAQFRTVVSTPASITFVESVIATVAGAYTKQVITLRFSNATASSTTSTFTITSRDAAGLTVAKSAGTFTLTTTAPDTTGTATKSLMWLHGENYTLGAPTSRGDSAIVVNAGTAATPVAIGWMTPEFRNAADTVTAGTVANPSAGLVDESMTVTVSGPGLLAREGKGANAAAGDSVKAKSMKVSRGETVVVYSDGTAGVSTLTTSIGGVFLTQAAKTITFTGKPATLTATLETKTVLNSGTAARVITFIAKDSAGNAFGSTDATYNTGTPGGFYALYSDTKVVSGTAASTTTGTTAAPASYTACTYVAALVKWACSLAISDSGTASITIGDSLTVGTSVVTSSAMSLTAVGSAYKGTITLPKATYNVGEKALITITAKDYLGNGVVNGAATPFASVAYSSTAATFGDDAATTADGGRTTSGSLTTYLSSSTTFVDGVDTVSVYMPTVAGTYTLNATTDGASKTAVVFTFTVVDPVATATRAAVDAAKDASDAATDAALEATDAAYAATDAANIAAEAADAATAAAEAATDAANAAKESADAATAAVEELATSVAKLMAALQAQITTLAKVVAKIAVKVKA